MKQLIMGVLAHVDAGKTTLTEALLYKGGAIRRAGRVDNGDAFLDTDAQERERGITIFSKQAQLALPDRNLSLTLLDTPGHVDFSAEMERSLEVLDLAALVISAVEGVQSHTKTLWKLLRHYEIPTVIFINKMDLPTADMEKTMEEIRRELSAAVAVMEYEGSGRMQEEKAKAEESTADSPLTAHTLEEMAMAQEMFLNEYLETGTICQEHIREAVSRREFFPVVSGTALKMEGIETLLQVISDYGQSICYPEELSVYCYKISRDDKNVRLTHLKIFGGSLKVKELLGDEKVNEIRLYSGTRYQSVPKAQSGMVVAVTGLVKMRPGDYAGRRPHKISPVLEPVLSYAVRYPSDVDRTQMLRILREVEEELPELRVETDEEHHEIRVNLMGAVQTEILTQLVRNRYQIAIHFDVGSISYKETITDTVEGVGHFEPLRHYAEVHLRLEPLERGSGLVFASEVSEDELDRNWQRLIRTHLEERTHRGVLTGSPIADMKITLVGGRAHTKHTEGGDFRQATYRALRQGLMQAHSRLLEPYYEYTLTVPENMTGRAMTDIDQMHGTALVSEASDGFVVLTGRAPVAVMHTYASEVTAYTRGLGSLSLAPGGYDICHNEEEVLAERGYDPETDIRNPASSVFCMHGAGTVVPWNEVFDYMHVPLAAGKETEVQAEGFRPVIRSSREMELSIGQDEIEEIMHRVAHANEKKEYTARKGISADRLRARRESYHYIPAADDKERDRIQTVVPGRKYFLVDGYNVIFAWQELKELAVENIDSARDKLLDYMRNYQAFTGEEVIVVFDAYKVPNRQTDFYDYYNIHVVFTRTSQTADQYIERFANKHGRNDTVTVVSSDGLVQLISRGEGCHIISSREFEEHYRRVTRI